MARATASWLSGPEPLGEGEQTGYAGEQLGLPASGSRSIARFGRRVLALLIDWLICYGLAALAMSFGLISYAWLSTAVLVVWFALGVASVRLYGFTPGQYACGLVVVRIGPEQGAIGHVGLGRLAARGLLIALVIPPLIADADGRGLHDRVTSTAVLRR